MSKLVQLQRDFQHCLLVEDDGVLSQITETGRGTPATQLAIYFNAYRLRLKECIQNDFPTLAEMLGSEKFDALARAYIDSHPSYNFSLRIFGQYLPEFLHEHPHYREMPVLAELAQFEWLLGAAFDSPDEPVLTLHDMAQIPPRDWPDLRLVFHPSVHRFDLAWNTSNLWRACNDRQPIPEVRKSTVPVSWIIWRCDLKTWFRSQERDEHRAFDIAQQNATFTEICEDLSEFMDSNSVPMYAASMLKGWISEGLVSRLILS